MLEEGSKQEYLCPGFPKQPQSLEIPTSLGNGNSALDRRCVQIADLLTPLPYLEPGDCPSPPCRKFFHPVESVGERL